MTDLMGDIRAWFDRLSLSEEKVASQMGISVERLNRIVSPTPRGRIGEVLGILQALELEIADVDPLSPVGLLRHLDEARVAQSMTKKELARQVGMGRAHLSSVLNDPNANPMITTITRLSAALVCPLTIIPSRGSALARDARRVAFEDDMTASLRAIHQELADLREEVRRQELAELRADVRQTRARMVSIETRIIAQLDHLGKVVDPLDAALKALAAHYIRNHNPHGFFTTMGSLT